MPLPLQDTGNPLYNTAIDQQCNLLINWQRCELTPQRIMSLNFSYSQRDLNLAYRNLATRFHPDKHNTYAHDLSCDLVTQAFSIIQQAHEYLSFRLMTLDEQQQQIKQIIANPFYSTTSESTQGYQSSSSAYGFSSWYWEKTYTSNISPLTEIKELLDEIYRTKNKGPLLSRVHGLASSNARALDYLLKNEWELLLDVASDGHLDFFKWLLELRPINSIYSLEKRKLHQLLKESQINILHYLFGKFGSNIFYTARDMISKPNFTLFNDFLSNRAYAEALFFLNDLGFLSQIDLSKYIETFSKGIEKTARNPDSRLELVRIFISQPNAIDTNVHLLMKSALNVGAMDIAHLILEAHPAVVESSRFKDELINILTDSLKNGETKTAVFILSHWGHDVLTETFRNNSGKISLWGSFLKYHIDFKEEQYDKGIWIIKEIVNIPTIPYEQLVYALNRLMYEVFNPVSIVILVGLYSKINSFIIEDVEVGKLVINRENATIPDKFNLSEAISILSESCLKIAKLGEYDVLQQLLDISPGLLKAEETKDILFHIFLIIQNIPVLNSKQIDSIHLLISKAGIQLEYDESEFRQSSYDHYNYNLLHYTSERGYTDFVKPLIQVMNQQGYSLDKVCIREKRRRKPGVVFKEEYSSLHWAIVNNHQSIAIDLISGGASVTKPAIQHIKNARFCGFFPTVKRIEKTPYELAVELKQVDVAKAIQHVLLKEYIAARQKEARYLTHFTLFGHSIFNFGYSREQKINAAQAYLRQLQIDGGLEPNDDSPLSDEYKVEDYKKVLSQGRLSKIVKYV